MANEKYNHKEIESKWKEAWEKNPPYISVDFDKKPKFYALVEYPYCSGEGLHMGHAFTNTLLDVLARKKRMDGFNVLHPMGWDSFGLPTENYAIKTGIQPAEITARNTKRFKETDNKLGISYNWEREIDTSDPKYYHWTQWIFLQLYKKGLAYKAETPVGWCPSCKIILANEEIVDGKCERCGTEAEYRTQKQWILKITAYADRLADELDLVDYPEHVKKSQRDWIGRSEGASVKFEILNSKFETKDLTVFTTRPDTLYGATFMVVAPEHGLVKELLNSESVTTEIKEYVEKARKKSDMERTALAKDKTGVFSGLYAVNPVTLKEVPIWISDFVLATYGTGAIMAVPAHDERDWTFAKKFDLPIIPVIIPEKVWDFEKAPYTEVQNGKMVNSPEWNDQKPSGAIMIATEWIEKQGIGKKTVSYHLRDWIFSRQHYWGEPIPMIHCPKCGVVPVPEDQLPVELPYVEKYQPSGTGESPLANIESWVKVTCPECGGEAQRETDTMPNWAGSCWYYLGYILKDQINNADKNVKNIFTENKDRLDYWMPVNIYLGGAEHNTLHLLYSRFWFKFLNDIEAVPGKEPYSGRRQHGVILGEDGFRMSKSRGNIINPEEMVNTFGADTLRIYLLFMGPYDSTMPWETASVEGCQRFLKRIWRLSTTAGAADKTSTELLRALHRVIKKVGEDIEAMKFNTAIAAMMEFINVWQKDEKGLSREDLKKFMLILAPFAPFIAEELWSQSGETGSIHEQSWPKYDISSSKSEAVTIVVQVNGKLRAQLRVINNESSVKERIIELARTDERVLTFIQGKEIIKIIFVPGKLINFVINQ